MPSFARLAAGAAGLIVLAGLAPAPALAGAFEDDVLAELNFARSRPADYARSLERDAMSYGPMNGSPVADADPDALGEALDFLTRQQPLPPLRADPRLAAAARAHSNAQSAAGGVGHTSPNGEGLGQRLRRQGVFAGLSAEDISYGYRTPRDVVRQLIIDSRVANRGHRQNIFSPAFQAAGVGCGAHRTYGAMCVIDFAGALVAR